MKRVIIICEGETEQEFCKTTLASYLSTKDVTIESPLIKHTHGGIVKWEKLKKQIENTLRHDINAYITLLIDYYGVRDEHEFPNWMESHKLTNKVERIKFIEKGMLDDINDDIRYRFIPYMQLHEFEALLFCDAKVIIDTIDETELIEKDELVALIDKFPNPEMINNAKETSPSHRIKKYILGYNKIVHGNILAENIGIETIRQKCLHFDEWLTVLENLQKI